jgi:ABC-2 type transport system permease protein
VSIEPSILGVDTDQATTGTLDRVGLVDPGSLVQPVPGDEPMDWLVAYPDEATAGAALRAGDIAGYYVVAPDYVASGGLTYVTNSYNPIDDRVDTGPVEWALLVSILGGDVDLAASVREPLDLQVTSLAPPEEEVAEESWLVEMLPTFMVLILYMALIIPGGVLISSLIDEKKNRVMEVLMTSVSPQQMVTGKIVALGLMGLLQIALWLGVLWAVARFGGRPLNIPAGYSVPSELFIWAVVYFLGGYAIYGAQFAGVGALVPDVAQSRSAQWVVMAPIVLAYLLMVPIFINPDGPLALVLSLFPLTAPVDMIARMTVADVPLWQALLAVVIQFATAIFIVRLTARLFRAQHLLTGQPFSVKMYYKTLFGRA